MFTKKILNPNRLRRIEGGFNFIPHRFLSDGFLSSLRQKEFLLYLFLILASDRYGLSFYSYDAICSFLQISLDEYIEARDGLIEKDLIAFDGHPLPSPRSAPTSHRDTAEEETPRSDRKSYPTLPLGGRRWPIRTPPCWRNRSWSIRIGSNLWRSIEDGLAAYATLRP